MNRPEIVRLHFLRHGPAVKRGTWDGEESLRPLTEQGGRQVEAEGRALSGLLSFDIILTSPYERAAATARLFATGIGTPQIPRIVPDLAPGFDLKSLKALVDARHQGQSVLLVGHEPDFSELIGNLCGRVRIDMGKGGLARVDWDRGSGSATLQWFFPAELVIAIGRGAPRGTANSGEAD